MQFDMFSSDAGVSPKLALPNAKVDYLPGFLAPDLADQYLAELRGSLAWREDHIKLFGKSVKIPRLHAWYGDSHTQYAWSGLVMQPLPWTPALSALKQQLEHYCRTPFNSVLANLYRDGQDSMGWHADNETELGEQPVIASISFGQQRNFDLRHNVSAEKVRIPLEHGSLLVMAGETQQYWQHAIAKTRVKMGERLNLTFRQINLKKN